jgi:hypothetical protein
MCIDDVRKMLGQSHLFSGYSPKMVERGKGIKDI